MKVGATTVGVQHTAKIARMASNISELESHVFHENPVKVLVTGGAGYIGSHMVLKLQAAGHQPVILDALLHPTHSSLAPPDIPLYVFDIADTEKLHALFRAEKFDVVMHFAALVEVGESVLYPKKYDQNNFHNTVTLLRAMKEHGVPYFIFSSTAAIFGEPQYLPIDEAHPKNPVNPYGWSKLKCEQTLQALDANNELKFISLRYFNAAGADPLLRTGFHLCDDTHLIPRLLKAARQNTTLSVYGRDYATSDGTCVRDYIHVMDLCDAHLLAMRYLIRYEKSGDYNLGNGLGFSVQAVIDTAKQVTGKNISIQNLPRRAGDPAILLADAQRIQQELHWKPTYPKLETILQHAWAWELKTASV